MFAWRNKEKFNTFWLTKKKKKKLALPGAMGPGMSNGHLESVEHIWPAFNVLHYFPFSFCIFILLKLNNIQSQILFSLSKNAFEKKKKKN